MAVDEERFLPTRVGSFSEDIVELVNFDFEPQPSRFSSDKIRALLHPAFFVRGEFDKLS
jgi:hypothetical protein